MVVNAVYIPIHIQVPQLVHLFHAGDNGTLVIIPIWIASERVWGTCLQ